MIPVHRGPIALAALAAFAALACACGGGRAAPVAPPAAIVDVAGAGSARPIETVDAGAPPPSPRRAERAPTEAELEQARARFMAGREAFDRGDYEGALRAFREAHRLAPKPPLLYNIGRTLELLGRHDEAAATYEELLSSDHGSVDRASLELRIRSLRAPRP